MNVPLTSCDEVLKKYEGYPDIYFLLFAKYKFEILVPT